VTALGFVRPAAFVAMVALTACVTRNPAKAEPRLGQERVSALAIEALTASGIDPDAYAEPELPQYVAGSKVWWVFYNRNIHPHSGILVVVNDRSERTCIQSGADYGQCP
jgi:hypothetical protein